MQPFETRSGYVKTGLQMLLESTKRQINSKQNLVLPAVIQALQQDAEAIQLALMRIDLQFHEPIILGPKSEIKQK